MQYCKALFALTNSLSRESTSISLLSYRGHHEMYTHSNKRTVLSIFPYKAIKRPVIIKQYICLCHTFHCSYLHKIVFNYPNDRDRIILFFISLIGRNQFAPFHYTFTYTLVYVVTSQKLIQVAKSMKYHRPSCNLQTLANKINIKLSQFPKT